MFQCIDVLVSLKTAAMLCSTLSLKVDGYRFRADFYRNLSAATSCRNGGSYWCQNGRTESVCSTDRMLAWIKGITGKWIQMDLFLE